MTNENIKRSIKHTCIEHDISIPPSGIQIHFKDIASGTSVIDDAETIKEAALNQDNLYGNDMEAYGVAVASSTLRTKWLIIKAVQDYADGDKEESESTYRSYAALASAKVFAEFILLYFS